MHAGPAQAVSQLKDDTVALRALRRSREKRAEVEQSGLSPANPPDIPTYLQHYVTAVQQPHEIYETLNDARDRKLRRLLRRFTNQIQYGCKNPRCDVPTCFSYRKRQSNTPVRPYNDAAARALAWSCVEDHARAPQDLNVDQELATLDKTRNKGRTLSSPRLDALCWNEPIVPWYEVPSEYFRRQSRQQPHTLYDKGSAQSPSIPCSNNDRLKNQVSRGYPSHGVTEDDNSGSPAGQDDDLQRPVKLQQSQASKGESPAEASKSAVVSSYIEEQDQDPHIHGATRDPDQTDNASFSQVLCNTESLRQLTDKGTLAGRFGGTDDDCTRGTGDGSSASSWKGSVDQTSGQHTPFPAEKRSVTSFNMLPASALLWLRYLTQEQPLQAEHTKDNGSRGNNPSSHDSFVKQSLFFVLSDPHRLLRSASSWVYYVFDEQFFKRSHIPSRVLQDAAAQMALLEEVHQNTPHQHRPRLAASSGEAMCMLATIGRPFKEVMQHITTALRHAFVLPSSLRRHSSSSKHPRSSFEGHTILDPQLDGPRPVPNVYLNDKEVASLCVIAATALHIALGLEKWRDRSKLSKWNYFVITDSRSVFGRAALLKNISETPKVADDPDSKTQCRNVLAMIDFDHIPSNLALMECIASVVSHRLALRETLKLARGLTYGTKLGRNVLDLFLDELSDTATVGDQEPPRTSVLANELLSLMRNVLSRHWNRAPIVKRTSMVGGALLILAGLFRKRQQLGLQPFLFEFKYVADVFDDMKMPTEWLEFREDNKQMHLLSFPFLFEPSTLVRYFRAINLATMCKAFEYSETIKTDARQLALRDHFPIYGTTEVLGELRPHMAPFFVLTVRRASMLEDAINQIWRRQRQELMRPLKVSLGTDEGENGMDYGGVTQEFFRIIFAQALDPNYGMFTIDHRTRMTWFQPGSLEPLYKFEVLGILMSLAVYNAVTLPITFPLAFYRKLLGLKVKTLDHIEDGWRALTHGLRTLRDWKDGDVGDVIARTYEFSFEAYGTPVNVDMSRVGRDEAWDPMDGRKLKTAKRKTATFEDVFRPSRSADQHRSRSLYEGRFVSPTASGAITPLSAPSDEEALRSDITSPTEPLSPSEYGEAPLVTNANRDQYIKDYVFWLAHKSVEPQFAAFLRGFHTCLDVTALSIFTPEALQTVVEGYTEIDIEALESITLYEDYHPAEPTIVDFWAVVKSMSPAQHRKLLEFVTASDRVPVNGIKSVAFTIQKNGELDDRLPSSSTCYGRLLLPKYSSREILREKLEKAIENSEGFGML